VLLGQGDASRLTLEVKRERGLVSEIDASAYTPQESAPSAASSR
jgi:predicted Zn-dependent peptidase